MVVRAWTKARAGLSGLTAGWTTRTRRVVAVTVAAMTVTAGVTAIQAAAAGNAPVARRDVTAAFKETQVYVNVTANDFDPDGESFSLLSVNPAANGTVSSVGSSGFYYTPAPTFSGTETITYTIRDSAGMTGMGTVVIQVDSGLLSGSGQPTPQTDYFVTPVDTAMPFTAGDLAANDTDPQAQVTTLVAVGESANSGTVTGSGPFTFTPAAGFVGEDTIEYLVVDPDGHVGVGTVYVQVIATGDTNRPPVARRDVERAFKGTQVWVRTVDNDSDPDGDSFAVVSVNTPAHGTVQLGSAGFYYTPDVSFAGAETITYTVRDSHGLVASSTATVWVDSGSCCSGQPTPATDYFVTGQDTPLNFTVAQLAANDSDPQRQVTQIIDIGDGSQRGTVEGTPTTGFTYTPLAGFVGQDAIEYLVVDPDGHVGVGTVYVQVIATGDTNRLPVADDDSAASPTGAQVWVRTVDNDSDPDGDPFAVVSVNTPAHGTVQLSSAGFYYTPDATFTGTEVLTYTIRDSRGLLGTAEATIVVRGGTNRPPVANAQQLTVAPGATIPITLTGSDPENSALSFTIVDQPNGTLSGSGSSYTYTAPATPGSDLIVFSANDGTLDSAPAGIFITIGANRNPTAVDDDAVTDEDEGVAIDVLANDTDADGDTLSVTGVDTNPQHGTAVCSVGGCNYLPAANYSGTDFFTYTVSDGRGGTAGARVDVVVEAVNDPPVAEAVTAGATTGPVTLSATDVDSPSLTFVIVDGPQHGSLGSIGTPSCSTTAGLTTCTAELTYTRNSGDIAADSFTYRADDGDASSAAATVTVPSTDAAPSATLDVTPTVGTAPLNTTITVGGADDNGDPLTYTLDFGDGSTAATGSLPAAAHPHVFAGAGVYTVRLSVSDANNTTVATQSVSVGLDEPLTANAGDDRTATTGAEIAFDGAASRPLIGIQTYTWDFGDGSAPFNGPQATHTYASAGQRTVTLTVTSGSFSDTDTLVVNVSDPAPAPGLQVNVTGGGSPLEGADVAVIDAEGVRYRAVTDANGVAMLDHLPDGTYTAYAVKAGFKPAKVAATVLSGSGSATVELTSGAIAQTEMTSHRMTYEEIIAAGIDPNDPQNQNIFEFEIHLAFGNEPVVFSGYASEGGFIQPNIGGGGGGGGGGGCLCVDADGYTAYPVLQYIGDTPTVLWMVIPGRAKWLKEFFEVKLLVTNLADDGFTFENGQVSLGQLPDGLSLAPTEDPQELVQSLPDIAGQATEQATWIVRGDTEGFYTLSADYTATLEPIGTSVMLHAATATDALHVWGGSALTMTVDVDDRADLGVPYRLRIGLTNVTPDTPVYNPEVELLTDNKVNYIYQPKERFTHGTAEIAPGETFWTDYYRLVPAISGTLDLSQSFVKKTAGNVDVVSTIVSHPAIPIGDLPAATFSVAADGVHLGWDTVGAASGYEIFRTTDRQVDFGALPVATLGPSATSAVIPGFVDGFFAVSSIIDGVNTMMHPMVGIPGTVGPPAVRPSITVSDVSVIEGDSGTTTGDVVVTLSEPTTVPVTVKYETSDVSAKAPADYVEIPETLLTFAPGETAKTVTVSVNGDTLGEKGETFAVKLYDAIGGVLSDTAGTVSILEDDGPVTIAVRDAYVIEGDSGTVTLEATVELSAPLVAGQSVKAKYRTSGGSATAGVDYTAVPLTPITFGPGEQTKTIWVTVAGDTDTEPNETFNVVLQGVVGAQVADSLARATIVSDDGVTPVLPLPTIDIEDAAGLELDSGSTLYDVTLSLSAAQTAPVSVTLRTLNGTATAGRDYTAIAPQTVTFDPGETAKSVQVEVTGDTLRELNEYFSIRLSGPTGATISDATARFSILGEEGPLRLTVGDTSVVEGDSGTATLTYTLTLDEAPAAGESVSVRVASGDGSAKEPLDYTRLAPQTITFAAGETTKTVSVTVLGDTEDENDEYVNLNASRPVNVRLADSRGRGTIVDDDGP